MKFEREMYFLLKEIPENTLKILKDNNTFIAGGALTSVFGDNKINDIDVYFKSKDNINAVVAYLDSLQCSKIDTPNSITYITDSGVYQIIKKWIGEPHKVINNFDYTICMAAYDFDSNNFVLNDNFLKDLAAKRLCFNEKTSYPLCSLFRLRKFLKRGFTISGSEIIKLGLCVNNLKIKTYGELREQLLGIDTLFLKDLTDSMLNKAETEYDFNRFIHEIDEHITNHYSTLFEEKEC